MHETGCGAYSLGRFATDEGKGFERRLSEFKMWWSLVKAVAISFFLT